MEIALDGVAWTQFPDRVREQRRVLSDADKAEYDSLVERLDVTEDDAEAETLEAKIDALAATAWAHDEVALAGAVITLNPSGEPKIERGLLKHDDLKALKALRRRITKSDGASESAEGEEGDPDDVTAAFRPHLPAKLVEELIAHKTLALRTEVAAKPDLALRLLILALASNALNEFSTFSLVRVRIDEADVTRLITRSESPAPAAIAKLTEAWRERLPAGVDALWAFITEADQQTLLELLAVLVAPAIELRPGRADGVVGAICEAALLDMSKYWSATVESYFEHVRKDVIVDAIKELNPALDRTKLDKAPKKEVLSRAKKAFKGSAWLPEPLRTPCAPASPAEAIAAE